MWILLAQTDTKLKRHYDKDEALEEAKRLCIKEGKPIEVFECIGQMQARELPVEFVTHKPQQL